MSTVFEISTPNVQKLYTLSMLIELRRWKDEFNKLEELCAKGAKMEEDGSLFEQDEAFVEAYLAAQDQKKKMVEKAEIWRDDMCAFFNLTADKLPEKLEDMLGGAKGKGRKKKTSNDDLDLAGQMQRWADMFASNLWGENGRLGGWSGRYLDALADYMCSNEGAKNPAFDAYIKPKIEDINKTLKRKSEYKSAQSLLLEKLEERKRKNPKIDLDNILENYMENVLVERANTFGPDNHFFRCMASGRFYIPDEKVSSNLTVNTAYSDYFLKNYGEKFYLPPQTKSRTKKVSDGLSVSKMLPIIADTYGEKAAESIKETLWNKGIGRSDWENLNSYDLAKILQRKSNAIAHDTTPARISDFCDEVETPYQQQARRLGFMLSIGKEAAALEKKFKADLGNNQRTDTVVRGLETKMVQMPHPPHYSFYKIWKEKFQGQFSEFKDFVAECANVYKKISSDFTKNGYGEYYEKWVEAMSQKGDYFPKFEGIKRPYEINIHHKVPVKVAKMLDRPADINDVSNYLMFVEFEAPTGEKLTKHLQEHAKESGSTVSIAPEPDARFYSSSGGVTLSHQNFQEPESFQKQRNKQAKTNAGVEAEMMIMEQGAQRA